jgi:thioredoxin reductase (NADPH)
MKTRRIISDICIIGAGPAGLTAGLFASRRGLKTCIIAKDMGGQAVTAPIENYPGIHRISGFDFAEKVWKQAEKYGCEYRCDEVVSLKKENDFILTTSNRRHIHAQALILACGRVPRNLGVPGERALFGKGVEYSRSHAETYNGRVMAIVGGGAGAVQSAIAFSDCAKKIIIIHRRDSFSAEAADILALVKKKNVECIFSSGVKKILGKKSVTGISIENIITHAQSTIPVHTVLIAVGMELNLSFLGSLVARNEKGEISVTNNNETSCEGIFAAGDATDGAFHQVVISAGEGAKAALSAYRFLQKKRGERSMLMDWEHS